MPLLLLTAFGADSATRTDLRVLIDVSGSMKTNDPHNLRAPSLRLLIGLMPTEVRSAIWTFATKVKLENPAGRADKKWKRRAIRASYRIHSRGRRTDIESALARATADWKKPASGSRRHLILLTDGMVDVSQDRTKNLASRTRILQSLLPRIKKMRAKIHTIALSDKADFSLLQTLSAETGGRHLRIQDAAPLHRVFLKLFEASTRVDKLPISANRFKVDRSITDMTVLLFKSATGKPAAIRSPGGRTWTAAQHPANVVWKQEKHYDLITINKPAPGVWQLHTRPDPDNRVIIATNLKLTTAALPSAILENESIRVQARLVQKDKTRQVQPALLALTRFYISRDTGTAAGSGRMSWRTLPLNDQGKRADLFANDGIYSARLYPPPGSILNQFSVIAKSPTFERVLHHEYRVYASAMTISVDQARNSGRILVSVGVMPGLFKPGSVKISVEYPDGTKTRLKKNFAGLYRLEVPSRYQGGKIITRITGVRTNGASYAYRISQQLPGSKPHAAPVAHKKQPPVANKTATAAHKPKKHKRHRKKARKKHRKPKRLIDRVNWLRVSAAVVLINLLAGGGLLFYLWRSGRLSPGGTHRTADSADDPDMESEAQSTETEDTENPSIEEGDESKEAA